MNNLRQTIKRKRRQLEAVELRIASQRAAARVIKTSWFLKSNNIAAYIAVNGELDPLPIMQVAINMGKNVYLPVLHPFKKNQLMFCRWHPQDKMLLNRFSIPEPLVKATSLLATNKLDLVITPLLAFDDDLNRMGMGGGFYDRSFQFINRRQYWRKPILVGYAHELQHVKTLANEKWDVKMQKVVTDKKYYK